MKVKKATLYTEFTPWCALVTVSLFLAVTIGCILRPGDVVVIRIGNLVNDLTDSLVYSAVADRVGGGEAYYDAAATELEARGYSTESVFNWRLPTYAWLLGKLPDPTWGWFILEICILLAIGMASDLAARDLGLRAQIIILVLLAISDAWVGFPEPVYYMEFWAGTFLLISLCFYFNDNWVGGIAAGSMAVLLRELALPYCMIMLGLACRQRRWREVGSWMVVFTAFGLLFYFHCREVTRRGASLSPISSLPWVAFGGVTSILSTSRMNFLLAVLPVWVTAVYVPLALLGLLGWPARGALPMKLTAVVYLVMFSLIGQPLNFYWGWLIAPVLFLGIPWAPLAIRDLVSCARKGCIPWRRCGT